MQFLVYLTVLMVAISTVLLEVHWLTSPAPQPKPTVQAGAPQPPPKVEGPNAALSPIYPKKLDAPRPAESNSQAQNASPKSVQTTSPTAPGSSTSQQQSAATTMVAPAQQPGPPAQATQLSAPPPQSPPAQQPASAQRTGPMVAAEPVTPPQQAQTAPSQQSSPQPSGANAASQQKPLRETTGAAVREDNTRQALADPMSSPNRANNAQQNAQNSSSNRCDVQACASTYRSFRASDCTYQPFDGGVRRVCEKSPGQRVAREREQPERRRWGGDAEARYLDRPASGRRFVDEDDDVAADFDDARREPLGFFLFGRRPRW
jgi:hypothetical protein